MKSLYCSKTFSNGHRESCDPVSLFENGSLIQKTVYLVLNLGDSIIVKVRDWNELCKLPNHNLKELDLKSSFIITRKGRFNSV